MRIIVLVSCLSAACAPTVMVAPPAATALATTTSRPSGDVALFVRDATGHSLLAGAVCRKLLAAHVHCRTMTPTSQLTTPWSVDTAVARAAGAATAMRVTVIQRREDIDDVNRAEGVLVPASGAVGRQQLIDGGEPHHRDDLRVEVIASLRRASDGAVMDRWNESEGILDTDTDDKDIDARWSSLYDEVADRLGDKALAALSQGR